jgi:hypothetical protein
MHVLLEHLLHVNSGWLRLETLDRSKRILSSSVSGIRRKCGIYKVRLGFLNRDRNLIHVQILLIPSSSVVIDIMDKEISSENEYSLSAIKIYWHVEFFFLE